MKWQWIWEEFKYLNHTYENIAWESSHNILLSTKLEMEYG